MQLHHLKSPGFVANGAKLRLEAFKAINTARVMADRSPESATGDDLRAFFLDCAEHCPTRPVAEPTPPATGKNKDEP